MIQDRTVQRHRSVPRSAFTLVELVAVLAIMALTAGLAVAAFRPESPARQVRRSAEEFAAFCARVRYQAMERAADRIVVFDPDTGQFSLAVPAAAAPAVPGGESESAAVADLAAPVVSGEKKWSWKPAERVSCTGGWAADGGLTTVFRFFPDGSGTGLRTVDFQCGKQRCRVRISRLTGSLRLEDGGDDASELNGSGQG